MRQFALQNDRNERIPLNGPHYFINSPDNLGVNIDPQFASLENGFYKEIKESSYTPQTFSATLQIHDSQNSKKEYVYYQEFLNFIFNSRRLQLVYTPYASNNPLNYPPDGESIVFGGEFFEVSGLILYDAYVNFQNEGLYIKDNGIIDSVKLGPFLANCKFVDIGKTEITRNGILECPIQFTLTSPWYSVIRAYETYEFPHQEGTPFDVDWTSEKSFDVLGHMPAGIDLVVAGEFETLSVLIYEDLGDSEIRPIFGYPNTTLTPAAMVEDFLSLEYTSKYDDSSYKIFKTASDPIDITQTIDITANPFIKIPSGTKNVKMKVKGRHGGSVLPKPYVSWEIFEYYRGV